MSNELERERALREYLDGGSRLSREYGAMAGEEPGPEIDNAVLQQAHAAVAPGASRWKRIAQPLALAATVVMTVSVVITMQGPETTSLPSASAPALDVADPFAAPVAAGQRAAPARDAAQKTEREQALPQALSSGQSLSSEVQPLAKSVDAAVQSARPTAAFSSSRLAEESRQRDEAVGNVRQDAAPAPSTALHDAAEEADTYYGFAPPPSASAEAVASGGIQQDAATAMADEAQEFAAHARIQREQMRSRSILATAGPPPAAESAVLSAPSADGDLASMQMAEPARADDGVAEKEREPESWLEEIRDLVADGAVDQARTELKDFLEVYPDYPLDDTLSTLKPR